MSCLNQYNIFLPWYYSKIWRCLWAIKKIDSEKHICDSDGVFHGTNRKWGRGMLFLTWNQPVYWKRGLTILHWFPFSLLNHSPSSGLIVIWWRPCFCGILDTSLNFLLYQSDDPFRSTFDPVSHMKLVNLLSLKL